MCRQRACLRVQLLASAELDQLHLWRSVAGSTTSCSAVLLDQQKQSIEAALGTKGELLAHAAKNNAIMKTPFDLALNYPVCFTFRLQSSNPIICHTKSLGALRGLSSKDPRTDPRTNPRTDPRTDPRTYPRTNPQTDPRTDPGQTPDRLPG